MARWRLMGKHYLNVPGTEWEYRETSQTGKQARKVFNVPLYLDPDSPSDQNYPGECIVAHAGKSAHRNDIIFVGAPTPDMEPMDEEAEAISKEESKKWINPIEALPGQYNQSLLDDLMRQLVEAQNRVAAEPKPAAPAISLNGIDPEAFAKVQQQLAELVAINQALTDRVAELEAVPEEEPEPEAA